MIEPRPPRVFISYSHDDEAHKERVLDLSRRLLDAGWDVRLDRFSGHPSGESWPQWMCRQIREADRIVCVCTPTYRERFEGDAARAALGVSWEGHLLRLADQRETASARGVAAGARVGRLVAEPRRRGAGAGGDGLGGWAYRDGRRDGRH